MSIMKHEGSSNSRKSRLPEGGEGEGINCFPMELKIISWDIQGFNGRGKWSVVKSLSKD